MLFPTCRPAWPLTLALLLSAIAFPGFAQSTFLLRGTVRDARTREPLVGASVGVPVWRQSGVLPAEALGRALAPHLAAA